VRPSPGRRLAGALLATATVLAACSTTPQGVRPGDATARPGDAVVQLVGLTFDPATLQVPKGKRVLWRWTDSVVHNVVSDDFVSSKAQSGGAYAVTFDRPGTYAYRCTLHTGMDGTIVVTG
jgi:plastocyanin